MALVVREFRAAGYRSLREIRFPVGQLSAFVGPNGAGKTNLYRALQLLQASAAGALSYELAAEGGMESALWAMLDWRFYHELRTDRDAPIRHPCRAVTSPTLSSDGSNLAAVFATLVHIRGDSASVSRMISDAFAGARLVVPAPDRMASFGMIFPDYAKRLFDASELSDGTLRYLALAGALLAYRLPAFVALNEPETSLHPDLLAPLARLIVQASERTQIWVVTHSLPLAQAIEEHGGLKPRIVSSEAARPGLQSSSLWVGSPTKIREGSVR